MESVRSKDGTTIAFDRLGEGPALILVGGAFQHRAIDPRTAQLAALLATGFTVFHYDRRGRGDSGDTAPYAKEREIEDLDALIAEAGGSAFVFGNSSGAILALEATRGRAVTKLALYEPPFIVGDSRPPLPKEYLTQLATLLAAGRPGDAVAYFMTQAAGVPTEFIAPMREQPFWLGLEAVAQTLPYDGAFMDDTMSGNPLPLNRWGSVTTPTLVVDGGASPAHMHNGARTLVEILPHARHITLDDQAHDVAPEVLAPVLAEFLAG